MAGRGCEGITGIANAPRFGEWRWAKGDDRDLAGREASAAQRARRQRRRRRGKRRRRREPEQR
jgi:hypothetical protein